MPQLQFHTEELIRLLEGREGSTDVVTARLRWFLHAAQSKSVSATCRAFGIARATFYRWAERFDATDLSTLEDRPTRPDLAGVTNVPTSQPRPQSQVRLLAAPPDAPTTPTPCCWRCRVRLRDWRSLRRTLFVASILTNVALVAALVGFALLEVHVHGAMQAANIFQGSSSVPFTFP